MVGMHEGATNNHGGGLRSADISLHRREKPLTQAEIVKRLNNWKTMREMNCADFHTVSVCNRAIRTYEKMLEALEAG
jgi:hypothetical protein